MSIRQELRENSLSSKSNEGNTSLNLLFMSKIDPLIINLCLGERMFNDKE